MTNVKTDQRYLDIEEKISGLEKNVSDIKETISKKAAELKQLAKSKKEFKLSRTLGDLSHQLFLKEEKTLKGKAEILTHEITELESDLKSTIRAIESLKEKINPLLEELKTEAIGKNDVSLSALRTEIAEIFKSLFPKVETIISLVLDNINLYEGRKYFLEHEKFIFKSWVPYALHYIRQLLAKGYDFGTDERFCRDLGIDQLRANQFFYGVDLYEGLLNSNGNPLLGVFASIEMATEEPAELSPRPSSKIVNTNLPTANKGDERGGSKELRKAREAYS